MNKNKVQLKLDEVQSFLQTMEALRPEHLVNASQLEKECGSMIRKTLSFRLSVQRDFGETSDAVMELDRLIHALQQRMKEFSRLILMHLKNELPVQTTVEDIIRKQENYYFDHGIIKTLEKQGVVRKMIQVKLSEIIPSHPKDEYPETRSMKRTFIVHAGPTNSGKTYDALEALKQANNGIYLSPLRQLALEVFDKLNQDDVFCNLETGEEEILVPFSRHTSSTTEKADLKKTYDVAVIDEGQMVADPTRGNAWIRAMLGLRANEIHVCCSLNAVPIIERIIEDCGDDCSIVYHERNTELVFEKKRFKFPNHTQKGDAFIVFSRKKALQVASALSQKGWKVSLIYGNLPPETRRKQVELFVSGAHHVIVATDAIGMGLNLPIRRIVFLENEKFDGEGVRPLRSQEIKQIAGRAGRRGLYDEGFVTSLEDPLFLRKQLEKEDKTVRVGFIAPTEDTVLSLPFGTLKERLRAWLEYDLTVPYLKKVDISIPLELLDRSEKFHRELTEQELYKCINIPFNHKDEVLLEQWRMYVDAVAKHKSVLKKPSSMGYELSEMETYYRQIDLYYSFGKAFGYELDIAWVRAERERVSLEIHKLLKERVRQFEKKCPKCKTKLPWNYVHKLCDSCFHMQYQMWD